MRKTFNRPIAAAARFFLSIGLKANHVTLFGLLGQLVAAFLIAQGHFTLAGVLVMVLAPFTRWMAPWHVWQARLRNLALFLIR